MESKIKLIQQILLDNGLYPGGSLHSWRCENSDYYPNYCDCVEYLAKEIATALEEHDGA